MTSPFTIGHHKITGKTKAYNFAETARKAGFVVVVTNTHGPHYCVHITETEKASP